MNRNLIRKIWGLIMLWIMLVGLAACDSAEEATVTPIPPSSTTAVAETKPIATVPPVVSPTILIPTIEPPPTSEPSSTPEPVATDTPEPTEPAPPDTPELVTPLPPVGEVVLREAPKFAIFKEMAVDTVPAIFHDPIAPDLSNVYLPFALSEDQLARLAANGFVTSPGMEKEFFSVYEQARYRNVPIFITSDSLLHSYHLLFDKVLRTVEKEQFIPLLLDLNSAMLAETDAQYQALKGTSWEEAALRAEAFIGVGSKLLDSAVEIPDYAQELVEAELALIESASGTEASPIFPHLKNGEDYTQYIPRGHYTRSEELQNYFKSMMWYGRMTFRLQGGDDPEVGRSETRSALLLVQALKEARVRGGSALDAWLDLYNPTVFFVGRSDDLTAFQYLDVIDAVYGPEAALTDIADDARLDTFIELANELPPPLILGLVIEDTDDVDATTKGFRFMGQRFVPDAYIFRQLIYRNVGTREEPRMLPMGLDVMGAMGSDRAYTILGELGETSYANYPEQMEEVRVWTGGLTEEEWTETLYSAWLYSFHPLLEEPGEGYPQFMQSNAWLDKQLNSSLGSWAELKHDTILYAKQVYAELGGGGMANPPDPIPALGYVEPVPSFYARLSALTTMTLEGLDERGLLSEMDRNSLLRLGQLADSFKVMAEKQLRGEPLSESEYYLIRYYGGELEHLVMASADVPEGDPYANPYMDEEPQAAVIADVATAPFTDGSMVLEEGVGRIDEIYVVVPIVREDGSIDLQVAMGGTFSYYEFPWPASDRLTDEKWQAMLSEGNAPPRPVWIASFFTEETEFTEFQKQIYSFQSALRWQYWEPQNSLDWNSPVADVYQPLFNELVEANQYIGHQWVGSNYRSFDIQADDVVVVTVRETWQDTLHELTWDYPDFDDAVLGQRGPYTLDATYTLQLPQDSKYWQVTNVVYANEPPEWESLTE